MALSAAFALSNSAVNLASASLLAVGSYAAASPYSPVAAVIERGVIRILSQQVRYGQLTLVLPDGREWKFAGGTGEVVAKAAQGVPPSANSSATIQADSDESSEDDGSRAGSPRVTSSVASSSTFVSGNSTPYSATAANHSKIPELTLMPNPTSVPFTGVTITPDLKAPTPASQAPHVTVHIHTSNFFMRILLSGDLGFAEAYMAGECSIHTTRNPSQILSTRYYTTDVLDPASPQREGAALLDLFQIIIRSDHPANISAPGAQAEKRREKLNAGGISAGLQSLPAVVFSALGRLTTNSRIVNSVRNSVGNIRAHYDISNRREPFPTPPSAQPIRFAESFALTHQMTYSCGIYPSLDSDIFPGGSARHATQPWMETDELERSQYAKLHHIIRKAKIGRNHRVLEIGSGWGSFAIEAVRTTGCTVDTLTLSSQQKSLAEERIMRAGLQDKITVHLLDFRNIPKEWYHTFDRLVSIEMLEAVGKEYIKPYFEMIDNVLNDRGVACFQVITIPEARFATYANTEDFIRKWIFPGGFLPSVSFTTEMIEKGSQGRLVIDSICNIGPHYARTLREWRIRFLKNFERDIVPALKDEHPEMTAHDIQTSTRDSSIENKSPRIPYRSIRPSERFSLDMAFVRDIKERSPSQAQPPSAPSLSDPSSSGFPAVPHRSQKVSAFKRARNATGAKNTAGNSSTGDQPPAIGIVAAGLAPTPSKPSLSSERPSQPQPHEIDAMLKDVQVENTNKVAAMSSLERQRELEELEESISPGILAMLAQRAQRRRETPRQGNNDTPHHEGVAKHMEKQLDGQSGLSNAVHLADEAAAFDIKSNAEPETKEVETHQEAAGPSKSSRQVRFAATEAPTPSEIQRQYFPEADVNDPSLQWLQEPGTSSNSAAGETLRFDLSGNPLTVEQAADLPSHLGLHHHGDEANQAGYTIDEILMLCASSFTPQRTIMLSLLGKIAFKIDTYQGSIRQDLLSRKIRESCLDMSSNVLVSGEKNSGLLRETITCLYAAIKAERFEDVDDTESLHAYADDLHIQSWMQKAPMTDLVGRIRHLLSNRPSQSVLSTTSIRQLLSILIAFSYASFDVAESIANGMSILAKSFISSLTWPLAEEEMQNAAIAIQTMRLSLVCAMTSRSGAKSQLRSACFDSYLRFLAVPPWLVDPPTRSSESMYRITGLVIRIFETVARYGLNGSLLSSSPELWLSVGQWVRQLDAAATTEHLSLAAGYFDLLRVWTVSATDPHSMEKEHDLVWTQVEGLDWAEEALHLLHSELIRSGTQSNSDLRKHVSVVKLEQAAIDLLIAWTIGVSKNTPRNGGDAKDAIRKSLPPDFRAMILQRLQAVSVPEQDRQVQALAGVAEAAVLLCTKLEIDVFEHKEAALAAMKSIFAVPRASHALRCLQYTMLQSFGGSAKIGDISTWTMFVMQAILGGRPGDETSLLALVDTLLDLPWDSDSIASISHPHGLFILRPFLHYAILPDLDVLVGPSRPLSNLLRVTTTLRRGTVARNIRTGVVAGLPLAHDWMFTPFNALLRRSSSPVFKQLPPAWNASRLQLLRATLVFTNLCEPSLSSTPSEKRKEQEMSRSEVLVNLMKVFVLEQVNPTDDEETVESELFRDPVVEGIMTRFLTPILRSSDQSINEVNNMADVATSFLGAARTFFQFYYDFIELYESISLGHKVFSQLALPPLAQRYPIDYRKLVWCEQPSALRTLRMRFDDVPREHGTLQTYFKPIEAEEEILMGYAQALITEAVHPRTHPFLYNVAAHHLVGALWTPEGSLVGERKKILAAIRASGRNELMEDLYWRRTEDEGEGNVGQGEVESVYQGAFKVTEQIYEKRKGAVTEL
ncbi:hypothetical protein QFC19_000083 [Naganishia cerealis]|uniref:Uncharacterized protein n=1 Tax=Naganishia cerealis TaxID=610337 RepID=A0ACC2WQ35_9TREE|nr:hypothetical protein QFC19_000083 [Naganishia cerealis]